MEIQPGYRLALLFYSVVGVVMGTSMVCIGYVFGVS